jgi:hypothetical protein
MLGEVIYISVVSAICLLLNNGQDKNLNTLIGVSILLTALTMLIRTIFKTELE